MKPSTTIKLGMLAVFASLSMNSALAQNSTGNGGGVHFCSTRNTIEVYDVYEAFNRYGLNIISTKNSVPEAVVIENAILKIEKENYTFGKAVREQILYLQNPNNFIIRDGIKLTLVKDANILMTDEGCEYRQLANWDDVSNKIFVKGTLYRAMDEFNHAAIKLHEAIYKASRIRKGENNSDLVRRLVGELLSDLPHTSSRTHELWTLDDIRISSENPKFELDTDQFYGRNKSKLYLGNISKEELNDLGTLKAEIVEYSEIDDLKRRIAEAKTDQERNALRVTLNAIYDKLPSVFGFSVDSIVSDNGNPIVVDKIKKSFDVGAGFGFRPYGKITIKLTFTKKDGTEITATQVLENKTKDMDYNQNLNLTVVIFANIQ